MAKDSSYKRRIAILSPFYYPELISTGKANTALGNALVERGWEVLAICSHPLYPDWAPAQTDAQLPGTRFFRGGASLRYPRKAVLRRALLEAWFAIHAVRKMWKVRHEVDVALSVYPPSLFATLVHPLLPRQVYKAALIHDLQGVYSDRKSGLLGTWLTRMIHAVEGHVFRNSDVCIFFSNDLAEVAEDSFRIPSAMVRVQYPFVTLETTPEGSVELDTALPPGRRAVVYSGALGEKQNSKELVALMEMAAREIPDVDFHVFSGGPVFDALRTQYEGKPGTCLQFHPLVAERDLGRMYERSDVQIIPQKHGTETGSLPSKLPNLLAAGVHILAACPPESEVCRILKVAGTATMVSAWTPEQFLAGVRHALAAAALRTHAERRAAVAGLLSQFEIGNLCQLVVGSIEPTVTAS